MLLIELTPANKTYNSISKQVKFPFPGTIGGHTNRWGRQRMWSVFANHMMDGREVQGGLCTTDWHWWTVVSLQQPLTLWTWYQHRAPPPSSPRDYPPPPFLPPFLHLSLQGDLSTFFSQGHFEVGLVLLSSPKLPSHETCGAQPACCERSGWAHGHHSTSNT